jgi:large subunit ribosomal protein L9
LATRLETLTLSIGAKAGESGKIFGSVNTIQIAEALQRAGLDIDRKQIALVDEHIKELGAYEAKVKLHREVTAIVKFNVVAE